LLAALDRLPATLLQGDLKLANLGLASDGRIAIIDWQMAMVAPVAVELGWFLVSNAPSLPVGPEVVLAAYWQAMEAVDGVAVVGDWSTQADLAILVGLLLRGWRKGLDVAAQATYPSGTRARDDLAWWCDRAVEAAARRL
jgi:aminoglycoside phosphotransferase (APT) family kinase protein